MPTPRSSPSDEPPTEADRAQATAMAEVLAGLIADCGVRLAGLDADAAHAAQDGELRAARVIHAKSLQLQRELDQLEAMQHRLVRRFFDTGAALAAVPSA